MAVVGSRSPVTDAKLARAVAHGFTELAAPLADLLSGDSEVERRLAEAASDSLVDGRSVVFHSAGAPVASKADFEPLDHRARRQLGARLGAICDATLRRTPVDRLAIAGGGPSGDVVRRLGVVAIEALEEFGPAMPLCPMKGPGKLADGLEAVFNGGQTGPSISLRRYGKELQIRPEEQMVLDAEATRVRRVVMQTEVPPNRVRATRNPSDT
jgi:uncharacterized protein YgbK (DUF1537 family)